MQSRLNMAYEFVERPRCPICDSAGEVLFSSPFDQPPIDQFIRTYYGVDPSLLRAAPYELVRCGQCKLIHQRYVADDRLLGDIYGCWANVEGSSADDESYRTEFRNYLESRDGHEILAAASYLSISPNSMVTLDYGMGWALWARIAAGLGCRSYGYDLSAQRLEFARANGVLTLTAEQIGEPQFHFINTEQVMEHLAEPLTVAKRLASALLPGGLLKISVPSAEGADTIISSLRSGQWNGDAEEVMPVHPLEHINSFTKRSLQALADASQLEIVMPPLRHRFAFLIHRGTLNPLRLAKTLKELARPIYQYHNRRNLYIWMRKSLS